MYNKTIIRFHGCALAEPGGPWHPTFVLGRLENLSFLYKSYAGHPRFYRVKALGSLQFSLEHSLGFTFCDIQNNLGICKCYQPRLSVDLLCNLCTPRLSIGRQYGPISINMSADTAANSRAPYRLTYWLTPGRSLCWHPSPDSQSTCWLMCWAIVDQENADMLTDRSPDSVDMSTDMLADTLTAMSVECRPTYWLTCQPTVDRYGDRESTDTWHNGRWCQTILNQGVHKLHKIPFGLAITLTSTLIILDITKTSSNNCL